MLNPSREQVRRFFCESWRKYRDRETLDGAETTAVSLINDHPEYHAFLEKQEGAILEEFTPERGLTNPFLHLSPHLAITEQININQPAGILDAYQSLRKRHKDHEAMHVLMECLGETLWLAQQDDQPLNSDAYLECIKRAL